MFSMFLPIFFAILVVLPGLFSVPATEESPITEPPSEWETFKDQYNRTYLSEEEEMCRLKLFKNNLKLIKEHNERYYAGKSSFRMRVNDFADRHLMELYGMANICRNSTKPTTERDSYKEIKMEYDETTANYGTAETIEELDMM